jgi:hypothetical protein
MVITSTSTDDDDDLPRSIHHLRDTVFIDGNVNQDYRFLVYTFEGGEGEIVARAYFDNPWEVSITSPMFGGVVDAPIIDYLKRRFNVIKQLGGSEGYTVIWDAGA